MAEHISTGPTSDAGTLFDQATATIQEGFPTYTPRESQLDTRAFRAWSYIAAAIATLTPDVLDTIFRYYGKLIQIYPVDATYATVDSTWTMRDTAGYTIPAGTTVTIPATGDDEVAFSVDADVVVPPGSSVTAAGGVPLTAVELGARGSGLSGTPTLVNPSLDFVTGIALVGTSVGGVDAETDDEYLDRLRAELQLLAPRPILPVDFEAFAETNPAVGRSLAIDGYNPADSTSGNERMVAVAVVAENGSTVSSGAKAEVDADLEARREVSFIVNVIDPTFNAIDVTYTAVAFAGFDTAAVKTAADQALTDYLSPSNWGRTPFEGATDWVDQPKVRYLEVGAVLNQVNGLDYLSALQIRKVGGSLGTSDVTLTGPAALTTVGTITGTVT